MPTLKGLLLNGGAWTVIPITVGNTGSGITTPPVTTPLPPAGTSSGAPAALSDIVWHQPEPIDPQSDDYTIAGWGTPVGGIGPFAWSTPDQGNFPCFSSYERRGLVRVYGSMPSNKTFRLTCTDARGATVTKSFTVNVAGSSPTMSCNDINPAYNCTLDTFYGGPIFRPTAPGLQYVYTGVTKQDGTASTQWVGNYGPKWYQGGAAVIPPGSYPVKFTGTSNGQAVSENYTIQIVATPATGFIEFVPQAVSTATPVGTVIGVAHATTPLNNPQFSLSDGGAGVLTVNNATGEVRIISVPNAAGTIPYAITVTDQSYTYTQQFNLVVAQGAVLPSSNMTMTVAPMTNYSYRAEYNQRALGTPTATGFPDMSKVTWSISDRERRNWMMDNPRSSLLLEDDDPRGGIGRPRFAADPASGAVVVQAHLSAGSEWFDLTATDGVRVCTKRITVPVTAVVGPKYYVGPQATAPSGMVKKATIKDALAGNLGWPPETDVTATAGLQVYVEYDPANPNRYVNDWEPNYNVVRRGYNGPFSIIGITGPSGELPFVGGPRGSSNVGIGDQGLFYCNNGDVRFENLELGFVHMAVFSAGYVPGSNRTMSLIRRAGGCSGDVTIINCDLHDADVPIEAGNSDGYWTLQNVRISNGSGCTSGGGANQHNAYLGMIAKITATDCLFTNVADGHTFKTRAAKGVWTRCRFYAGERGSAFNALDLCVGGDHTLVNCHFEKGPADQNPYTIQYAEELPGALPWNIPAQDYVNKLSFDHCTFTNHSTRPVWATGEHGAAAINYVGRISPNTGIASTLSITNCTFEGFAANEVVVFSSNLDPSHDFSTNYTQSGNTYTNTTFTPLDFTSPVSKDLGRPGWHDSVADLNGGKNFPYFNQVQIDPGVDEIRIPANSAAGTVICATMRAYGAPNWSLSGNPQPDPRIGPFIAGTQWSNGTKLVDYTGSSFGYANSRYTIVTNSDGTATLKVGSTGLSGQGCDVILVRATSPSSTGSVIVEIPLFIVKT